MLTTIARAPSIYRHPTFCVATSQASPVSLAAAVHENRGRMIKPRIDVTIAPREKLPVLRAFSTLDTVGRASGVHAQNGECGEEVVSRLWHIFEESKPGD